jgi:hypothetical protein
MPLLDAGAYRYTLDELQQREDRENWPPTIVMPLTEGVHDGLAAIGVSAHQGLPRE